MSDPARLLAEIHAARTLVRDAGSATPSVAVGALWAHARRPPGATVDLAVARSLRTDPEAARRYRAILAGLAVAHAPMAAAASDGALRARRVGAFTLEALPGDAGSPPLLVIRGGEGAPTPRLIEAALGAESVRLELGEPVAGASLLALDPAVPEAALLARLLSDPASAVYLL